MKVHSRLRQLMVLIKKMKPGLIELRSLRQFGCVLVISFTTSRSCSRKRSPTRVPVMPMYSFLYEVRGGCGKIVAVSGSFWSSLKFLRMMFLAARLLG